MPINHTGGTGLEVAPSAVEPTLVDAEVVILQYPFDTPTLTLELRSPELNDRRQHALARISRESMGGTPIVFRDGLWPKSTRLVYVFQGLTEAKKVALQAFILASLGKDIKLTDYETQIYKMMIVNPDAQFVDIGPCNYEITLEFEGSIV
jgi:hypothetical protein